MNTEGAAKPKVLYVLPEFDSVTGSHFFHLYELLREVAREIDIFLVIEKGHTPSREFPLRYYRQRFAFTPLRFLEILSVAGWRRLAGTKYFYTHYSLFGGIATWLVTRLSGGSAYYWNCGMPWLYQRSRLAEGLFRFVLRHTILVTGTPKLARMYAERYGLVGGRTRVVPNWIRTTRFQSSPEERREARRLLGIPETAKVVLFVHRLSRRKGAHYIAEIAAEVTKRLGNAMFVIVGAGPEEDDLKRHIGNLKLQNSVRLMGEVPHRDIPNYFRAADVFFMPSDEEGFPHVLLEAMAAGIPYVASDVGGVREITPPRLNACIAPPADIKMFAEKIFELVRLPEAEIFAISSEARAWVEQYDISVVAKKFVALFT